MALLFALSRVHTKFNGLQNYIDLENTTFTINTRQNTSPVRPPTKLKKIKIKRLRKGDQTTQ